MMNGAAADIEFFGSNWQPRTKLRACCFEKGDITRSAHDGQIEYWARESVNEMI